MAMILTPSIPPVFRAMFTVPNIAIENAMACKVFRDIKLGIIPTHSNVSSFERTAGGTPAIFHNFRHGSKSGNTTGQTTKFSSHGDRETGILKTVEMDVTADSASAIAMNIVKFSEVEGQSSFGRASSNEYTV